MKHFFTLSILILPCLLLAQSNYSGNGNTGFGGVLGTGTLQLNHSGNTISGIFTRGSGFFNDAVVIYINSVTGGFSTTSGFTDQGDPLRKAISGRDGGNQSVVNFASGFGADYALAFDNGFGGIWQLVNGGSHNYITSVGLNPTGTNSSPTYTFSFDKSHIGITGTINFTFVATYLNKHNAYRSNEAIGNGMPNSNPGVPSTVTFTNFLSYPAIPAPVNLLEFKGERRNDRNLLNWTVENTNDLSAFILERSGNQFNFTELARMYGTSGKTAYSYTDASPLKGNNFYRLKIIETDGQEKYSSVVRIHSGKTNAPFSILANPVLNRTIQLATDRTATGTWQANVMDAAGRILFSTQIVIQNNGQVIRIPLPTGIPQGVYLFHISSGDERYSIKFSLQ